MKDRGQIEFQYEFVRGTIAYFSYLKSFVCDSLNKCLKWKYLGELTSWWQHIHSYMASSLETRSENEEEVLQWEKNEQSNELRKKAF